MSENQRIKILREAIGLNQGQFARTLGLTQGGYCDIEKGRNSVSVRIKLLLTKVHGANIHWLETGEGGMFLAQVKQESITCKTSKLKISGLKLKQALRRRLISQNKAAKLLGVSRQTLNTWGKLAEVSDEVIQNVKTTLHIDLVQEDIMTTSIEEQDKETVRQYVASTQNPKNELNAQSPIYGTHLETVASMKEITASLKGMITSMETTIATKDEFIKHLKQNIEQLTTDNQRLHNDNQQLKSEVNQLRESVEHFRVNIDKSRTDMDKLREENEKLREHNRSLLEEHRRQQQIIEGLKPELATIKGGQKRELVS